MATVVENDVLDESRSFHQEPQHRLWVLSGPDRFLSDHAVLLDSQSPLQRQLRVPGAGVEGHVEYRDAQGFRQGLTLSGNPKFIVGDLLFFFFFDQPHIALWQAVGKAPAVIETLGKAVHGPAAPVFPDVGEPAFYGC